MPFELDSSRKTSGAPWLIAQPLLLGLIGLPAMVYIIRTLGPLQYGQWAVAAVLVDTTALIAYPGLRPLFVRSVAQEAERVEEGLAEQLGLRGLLGCMAGLAAILICMCLRYPTVILTCTLVAAVGMILSVLGSAGADVLHGLQRLRTQAVISFIAGAVLTVASTLAVRLGVGPIGLTVAYLTGPLTSLLLILTIIHRQHFRVRIRWNCPRFRELLGDARSMGAYQILAAARNRMEQLLTPKLVGVESAGYFFVGSIPADRLAIVPDGLVTMYYPVIARSSREEDDEATSHYIVSSLVLSLVLTVPLAAAIAFLAGPIGMLFFSKSGAICTDVIRITIWAVPLMGLFLPMSCAMQASGKFKEMSQAGIRATVCGTVISVLLISCFGIQGACWSWVSRAALLAGFLFPRFTRSFPVVAQRVPFGRIMACTVMMIIPMWLSGVIHAPASLAIGLVGGVAVPAYLAALLGLRVIRISQVCPFLTRKYIEATDRR